MSKLDDQFKRILPDLPADEIARIIGSSPHWEDAVQEAVSKHDDEYSKDPVEFVDRTLGYKFWERQQHIARSIVNNPYTVVESGHATGKSLASSALACWWLTTYDPAVVVTIAPCYDDQTEVLTDKGWKKFSDLDKTERVMCLNKDGSMSYQKPEQYFKFRYKGELIGLQNQSLDFLVTPNHRMLWKGINMKDWKVRSAEEVEGKTGVFRKIADWKDGVRPDIDEHWAELLGFYFAEGWSQVSTRKNRIVLTNTDRGYVEDLLSRAGVEKYSVYKKQRPEDGINRKGCWDFTIYGKEIANEFAAMGTNGRNKRVPDFIRFATPDIIEAFLHGFYVGDGGTDKNGSVRLYTVSKDLAGDLQELLLKIGKISTVYYNKSSNCYVVGVYRRKGKYPKVYTNRYKKHWRSEWNKNWYRQNYDGFVYCVKVPDPHHDEGGMILVRRNGKYFWSGNTHAQVQNILWRYMRHMVRGNSLPGEIFETPRWQIHSIRYAVGLSPRKATQEDVATLQGYHSKYLLVIMDEAAGLPRILWEAVRNLVTSEHNRVLAIGNPIAQSGPFWDACQSDTWNHIHISCMDHPNVVTGNEIIPGAVSRSWVEAMIIDHTSTSDEMTPGSIHIPWMDRWVVPDPVFKSRVMGVAPGENDRQLISYGWIETAKMLLPEPIGEVIIGLDPSRTGGDFSAMVARKGGRILWIKRKKPTSKNPGTELAHWLAEEGNKISATRMIVEEAGLGAAVVDIGRTMGLPIVGIYPSSSASEKKRFHNLRAEMYWRIREALREGAMNLPEDDLLAGDLVAPEYSFDLHGRIQLEKKEAVAKRIGRSPDSGDALALTFAIHSLAGVSSEIMKKAIESTRMEGGSRWFVPQEQRKRSRWGTPFSRYGVTRRRSRR